jgi:hypothetical protein
MHQPAAPYIQAKANFWQEYGAATHTDSRAWKATPQSSLPVRKQHWVRRTSEYAKMCGRHWTRSF